ncbi:MAG: DUF4147 domain-containing protein [Clostridia bacterium]|nr:DUF4147 domain-containing protein [Clostridia bacterium]
MSSTDLRQQLESITRRAVSAVLPEPAVRAALAGRAFPGRVFVAAIGKAAWRMASAAIDTVDAAGGVVVTREGQSAGPLPGLTVLEASHPVPTSKSVEAAEAMLRLTEGLRETDTVLLLLSGGGSALFEKPLIPLEELQMLTEALLRSGADIGEINLIRRRLSAVKAGRFAMRCAPARVLALVLSDVLGDAPESIASGPVSPDPSTAAEALAIAQKYRLPLSEQAAACLRLETPKAVRGVDYRIIGSVRLLCAAALDICRAAGYEPLLLTDQMTGEAAEAGRAIGNRLREAALAGRKTALVAGGETVVRVRGSGLGGRCQELALAAAEALEGLPNAALMAIGSDGIDGPTDAAGGYVDGFTLSALRAKGLEARDVLARNDAYHALEAVGALVKTGPTGTNVNDLVVGLCGG